MKKILVLMFLLIPFLSGCGSLSNQLKHFQSSMIGLNREISLYDYSGKVIRIWETRSKIEDNGGTVYFLDAHGKAITISGIYVIEEK